MTATKPEPPASLPTYLADGLPKQNSATLRETQSYLEDLLAYRARSIEADELPAEAEPVGEETGGHGTLVEERVTCGDESCHCMSGGEKHGPYLYRYVREGGQLKSEYVGKPAAGDG